MWKIFTYSIVAFMEHYNAIQILCALFLVENVYSDQSLKNYDTIMIFICEKRPNTSIKWRKKSSRS